jgi:hypothetical protein
MAAARGFIGSGDLYISRIVGGVEQGLKGPFETERFEIKANAELKERRSKGKGRYGQVVASAALPQPFDLNITLGEADANGLSIALLGTASAANQAAGGPTTNTAFTAALDIWVPLPFVRLTAGAQNITNTAGSTTYVEGTDYRLNRELGWFMALSTGAITASQALHGDFTYAAVTGTQILAATSPSVRAKFVLDGVNLADDSPSICTAYEAVVASDAAVDFLNAEFLTVPLPGRLVTPVGLTSPFKVELRNAP